MKHTKKRSRSIGALTAKQQRFCMAYVETCNAAEAYRRAYDCVSMSPGAVQTEALRLREHPAVRAGILKLQAQHRRRHEVTVDKTLTELSRIAFSDIRNVLDWGPAVAVLDIDGIDGKAEDEDGIPAYKIMHGLALKAAAELSPEAAAAIAEISQAKDGTLKIKLHDKLSALDKIGRHLGMFKEADKDDAAVVVTPDAPREIGADHLAELAKRYAGGLKVVQGGKGT